MNFEHKGKKFGISSHNGEFFFYSEKMLQKNKPQKRLKAKTLNAAIKEINKIIDESLRVKK